MFQVLITNKKVRYGACEDKNSVLCPCQIKQFLVVLVKIKRSICYCLLESLHLYVWKSILLVSTAITYKILLNPKVFPPFLLSVMIVSYWSSLWKWCIQCVSKCSYKIMEYANVILLLILFVMKKLRSNIQDDIFFLLFLFFSIFLLYILVIPKLLFYLFINYTDLRLLTFRVGRQELLQAVPRGRRAPTSGGG